MPDITDPMDSRDEFELSEAKAMDAFIDQHNLDVEATEQAAALEAEDPQTTSLTEGGKDTTHPIAGLVKGTAETALQPVLGVGDFVSDVVGLVPWLQPVDEYWDNNSYRSTHPGHTLLRDASSIIIPTMYGGGAVVGSLKKAKIASSLPGYAKTIGKVAAWTGVDTGVAMISSHSKKDDNLAGVLNDWLGVDIPWGTRASDSPDVRWKKNVLEAAGFSGGVELLGAAFTFGRKAKLFPRDSIADEAINKRNAKLAQYDDPVSAAIEPRREARNAAQLDEGVDRLKKDPTGEGGYDPFINDIGEDSAGRAVNDLEADPLKAKLDQTLIQRNIDTYNGRMTSVVGEGFQKKFMNAVDADERALLLDDLFDSIAPNFDATVNRVNLSAEKINQGVDNLIENLFGKDISFTDFQTVVDDMKAVTFDSHKYLSEEDFVIASRALREAYEKVFDPNQIRAAGMLTQQAADNVADAATAGLILGEGLDTSRQTQIMFEKLALLSDEVKANQFITSKAVEYKNLKNNLPPAGILNWLKRQSSDFNEYLSHTKAKTTEANEVFHKIAKENPNYHRAFQMLYDRTNGDVDQIYKMHAWAEDKIGFLKKAIYDKNPEVPSVIVQGMHAARINGLLLGLSPIKAGTTNSALIALKPISVFAGAAATGNVPALKRAWYVYGGVSENIKRAFKVVQQEWHNAIKDPEQLATRGRADLRQAKIEDMEILDEIAEGWRANGEQGKLAMYNIAKGLNWWNDRTWTKLGVSMLYALDGGLNSFMASLMARGKAYDNVFASTNGSIDFDKINKMQRQLYSDAFTDKGVLKDSAAKLAASELALNLDSGVVQKFDDFLSHVPAARGLFLFPRTGVNALELSWSFSPLSSLGPGITRARRTLAATTDAEKLGILMEHGIAKEGDNFAKHGAAFTALKNEYIGRQIMGSAVIMGVGMLAMEGSLTGNGPQNAAEKRRMLRMGWMPNSIKNPITGKWHSYKGFEPFDKMMGLTADVVYQANRVDQAITEDAFRKLGYAITMNITNSTFLSGFNPIAGLISADPSSWNRFLAQQVDHTLIPLRGVRSILNNTITPQLKDVENDFFSYLKNANKFLFSGNENLQNLLDVYTGEPIKHFDPLTAAANAVLPTFKLNGGGEPWRQWLLATGWDGLQNPRINKITKQPLSTKERYFINNWIAKNADLKGQIIALMNEGNGFWTNRLSEYVKRRGLKNQRDFPIKNELLHKELDRIHDQAYDAAWASLEATNEDYSALRTEIEHRNWELESGTAKGAAETQENIQRLLQNVRY